MKRKILLSVLIVAVLAIFPIYSATAQQNQKGMFQKEDYALVFTDETAMNYVNQQNEEIDRTISVTKLFDQKLQAYMQEHPDLTEEEAAFQTDRLHEEARREAAGSNYLAEEKARLLAEVRDLEEQMPVISSSDSNEIRNEKTAIQKKYYGIILAAHAQISLMENNASYVQNSPEELALLNQINDLIDCCSVSDDGKTLLIPENAKVARQLQPFVAEYVDQTQPAKENLAG